jgi:subtilisin-like proprotein convertase family protein
VIQLYSHPMIKDFLTVALLFFTFSVFAQDNCVLIMSTDIPVYAPGVGTAASIINFPSSGTITDVNVVDISGNHARIQQLTVSISSPATTSVILFDQICYNVEDFDVSFNDTADPGALPCPPTGGGTYQSQDVLSSFNGEDPLGDWTLTLVDHAGNGASGTLRTWGIEVCFCKTTESTDIVIACDTYDWMDGNTYTTSNNSATFTLTNAAGCDSIVTLDLTINHSTAGTDVQTACDSYLWMDGNTYTESNNTATFVLKNAADCDSIVTLDLTINHSTAGTDVQTACDSYLWMDGNTYTESNNAATFTLTNTAGCDSIVTLDLTIKHSTAGTDVQTACDSYLWIDGNTYAESNNTATFTLKNAADCDSIVTLDLTIIFINNTVSQNDLDLSSNQPNGFYQWVDCNDNYALIPGDTSQLFTATSNGEYAVIVNVGNCSDTSNCIVINNVGLAHLSLNKALTIYPNPSINGLFHIEFKGGIERMEVMDMTGRLIALPLNLEEKLIDGSLLSPGSYMIKCYTNHGLIMKQVVVAR